VSSNGADRADDHGAVRAITDAFHLAVERADHVHRRCHVGGQRPAAHLPEHEVVASRHDFHVEIPVQRRHPERQP
jgi:hypothetical protein